MLDSYFHSLKFYLVNNAGVKSIKQNWNTPFYRVYFYYNFGGAVWIIIVGQKTFIIVGQSALNFPTPTTPARSP